MSADEHEQDYHLTPRGWEEGDSFYYGHAQQNINPPSDRVLTMADRTEQSHPMDPSIHEWIEKWRSPDSAEVERLIRKFGSRPR